MFEQQAIRPSQTLVGRAWAFLGAAARLLRSEQSLIQQFPETLKMAHIVCADGFDFPVAVNKQNWGKKDMQIGGQTEVLHDQYHHVAGYKHCNGDGLRFDFTG